VDDAVWVIGDPQGWLEPLQRVLTEIGLIGSDSRWTGGADALVVAGDLVDRGPDGIGVIDLLMRLQTESGGRVRVVIGNHDVIFLAAHRFGGAMLDAWLETGGVRSDLERLAETHVVWLSALPAMMMVSDTLVVHADGRFYLEYGSSVERVNAAFARILCSDDLDDWQLLLDRFGEHRTFVGDDGEAAPASRRRGRSSRHGAIARALLARGRRRSPPSHRR